MEVAAKRVDVAGKVSGIPGGIKNSVAEAGISAGPALRVANGGVWLEDLVPIVLVAADLPRLANAHLAGPRSPAQSRHLTQVCEISTLRARRRLPRLLEHAVVRATRIQWQEPTGEVGGEAEDDIERHVDAPGQAAPLE